MTRLERGQGFVALEVHGEALIRDWGGVQGPVHRRVLRHETPLLAQLAFAEQVRRLEAKGYRAGRSDPSMVQAIQAAPDRAASYLVYGDWLLSKEDPRGELIVRMSRGDDVEPLLREHAPLLRPEWMSAFELEWRLGFLRKATGPANDCWRVRQLFRHPSALALEELVLVGPAWRVKADWDRVLAERPPTLQHVSIDRLGTAGLSACVPGLVRRR